MNNTTMEKQHTLDVRVIEPGLKHPFIFKNFDNLLYGEILTIVNDNDPLPLYYQLHSERPGVFEWEYIEQGPRVWKVNITKIAKLDETLAEVVLRNPAAASVLRKYHIDYCCQGSRVLEEACLEAGLDPANVKLAINLSTEEVPLHLRADQWPLDFLIDYILKNHHAYVQKCIPEILHLLKTVESQHGRNHPELAEIRGYFKLISQEMAVHMQQEEETVFPVIRELMHFTLTGRDIASYPFESVQYTIEKLENDHGGIAADLAYIRQISNHFIPPTDACSAYRLLFKQLEEFEDDLHQHVHLENNVLFPKALELEKHLR